MALLPGQILSIKTPCANSITCLEPLTEHIDNTSLGLFLGQTVTPPQIMEHQETNSVLGKTDVIDSKHIYIDLGQQMLFAYQDTSPVMTALVSTGRWGWTPVGNFHIQSKFRATRMAGGSGNDYYNLPNVPYTMFFHGDFGIHGAYWHNNFGSPMSHGCVNMRITDAQALFEWADGPQKNVKGTPVSVCQTFIAPDVCIQDRTDTLPTPLALPAAFATEANEQISPDGTQAVVLQVEKPADGSSTYTLFVFDVASQNTTPIMTQTIESSQHLTIPYNTWSPDNKYFFVEEKTENGTISDVQVFKASGEFPAGIKFLTVAKTFSQKQPNVTLTRVPGWASETLLILNSQKTDLTRGPSFWFEVPSQAVVPLSQQF